MRVTKGLKKICKGMSGYNREKLRQANFKKRRAKENQGRKDQSDAREAN